MSSSSRRGDVVIDGGKSSFSSLRFDRAEKADVVLGTSVRRPKLLLALLFERAKGGAANKEERHKIVIVIAFFFFFFFLVVVK